MIDDFNSYYDGLSEIPISQYQSDAGQSGISKMSKRSKLSRITKRSGLSGGSIREIKVYRMKQTLVQDKIEEEGSDDSNENKNGLKKRLSITDNGDIYNQLMKLKMSEAKRNQIMQLIAEEDHENEQDDGSAKNCIVIEDFSSQNSSSKYDSDYNSQ